MHLFSLSFNLFLLKLSYGPRFSINIKCYKNGTSKNNKFARQ